MRVVPDLDVGQDGGAGVADGDFDAALDGGASLQVAEEQATVQGDVANLEMTHQGLRPGIHQIL